MKKVLVNEKVSPDALNILKTAGEVVYIPSGDHDEIRRLVNDVTAVMLDTTIKFTGDLMDMAPELKVISRTGTGVDNVDTEAATKRGIMVLHTPDANTLTVAEHTVAFIGAVSKHLLFLDGETRRGGDRDQRLRPQSEQGMDGVSGGMESDLPRASRNGGSDPRQISGEAHQHS